MDKPQCPTCGRFVSENDGWYERTNPHDDESELQLYCDELCGPTTNIKE